MTLRIVWGDLATALVAVLGRLPTAVPVVIPDHALTPDPASHVDLLQPKAGAQTPGLCLTDLTTDESARLHHIETALGASQAIRVDTPQGAALCLTAPAFAPGTSAPPGLALALIDEVLRWYPETPASLLAIRRGPLAVQAASRLRAGAAPATLRHRAGPGDVATHSLLHPYAHFFAVEERQVSWRQFDSQSSATVNRAVFVSGDAVTVLPYDPARDRVLLVEQFRAGPHARGDAQPWQLEAIAGRVDPAETPETAARREAVEEAGLTLTDLRLVAAYYPSPGAMSEFLYSYVALTDLPDGSAGVFGLAEEAEDIRGHLIPFDQLMDLVTSGEVQNAPLILTALWLQRERAGLRTSPP